MITSLSYIAATLDTVEPHQPLELSVKPEIKRTKTRLKRTPLKLRVHQASKVSSLDTAA